MDTKVSEVMKNIQQSKHYEDLYNVLWKSCEPEYLQRKHYKDVSIGLFNVPCGGFGDIIVTKTFHDYLKKMVSFGENIDLYNKSTKIQRFRCGRD